MSHLLATSQHLRCAVVQSPSCPASCDLLSCGDSIAPSSQRDSALRIEACQGRNAKVAYASCLDQSTKLISFVPRGEAREQRTTVSLSGQASVTHRSDKLRSSLPPCAESPPTRCPALPSRMISTPDSSARTGPLRRWTPVPPCRTPCKVSSPPRKARRPTTPGRRSCCTCSGRHRASLRRGSSTLRSSDAQWRLIATLRACRPTSVASRRTTPSCASPCPS